MEKRWLNVKDFHAEFGIAESTQAKMRKERKLPYSKLGGFIFYDRNLINEVLENHCMVGASNE